MDPDALGYSLTSGLHIDMQKAMQTDVTVFRNRDSLSARLSHIREVKEKFNNDVLVRDNSLIWNTNLIETLEMPNLFTCAV